MRISRDQMFIEIAHVVSKRSTCHRLNVGAVIVKAGRVISIGYNGTPAGHGHCTGNACVGITPGKCPTLHAEANAIVFARASYGDAHGTILYCTDQPCLACSNEILRARINRVVFDRPYRDDTGINHLMKNGIHVEQITPAGYIIDRATGLVRDPTAAG